MVASLTGLNSSDTLRLLADGPAPDSLRITFTIRGLGRQLYRETWTSRDELVDPPEPPSDPASARDSLTAIVLDRLAAVFGQIRTSFIDTSELSQPWHIGSSDCGEAARGCIAWYLRYEAARRTRVNHGLTPVPLTQPELGRFLTQVNALPVDSLEVERIATDIRRNTKTVLTLSYGYETTIELAWSSRSRRFFVLFECC